MTWAGERRLFAFLIIGAILAALLALVFIAVFYQEPTCSDGIMNQDEEGVDCGGSCRYLCTMSVEPPTVLFTQALDNGEGRTDVIALVENKNHGIAAEDVPYMITIYGYDQSLVHTASGTFDLPPGETVPVFLPGIASGFAAVGTAFLTVDADEVKWYALPQDPRIVPRVSNTALGGTVENPRVTAVVANPDVRPMVKMRVIAVVRDASGNAIAASQTILASIPPQGEATAIFTWNSAFDGVPVSIQVLPAVPLP